jgi:hypothetical protein
MKRGTHCSNESEHTTIKIKLNNSILEDNVFLSRRDETLELREFVNLLKPVIVRDELVYLQGQFNEEFNERNHPIVDQVPDDVWRIIFRLVAKNKDISKVFPFKQVCKRWESSFPGSLTDVTIRQTESLQGVVTLPSLRSLLFELLSL